MEVKPGQVWADCDKRFPGRRVKVEAIEGEHAVCTIVAQSPNGPKWKPAPVGFSSAGRRTRILVRRMKPARHGFRLERQA